MGMVKFYSCRDDNKKLNKNLTEIRSFEARFKGPVSQTDPVLFVENFDFSQVNYMWVEDYNRFYFVTDIQTMPGGVQVNGHVDVLMSFNGEIKNMGAIVARSTTYSNPDIIDYNMKTVQYKTYDVSESNKSLDSEMYTYLVIAG